MFKLGKRSLDNLVGVHPDLVKIVKRAIELTKVDFVVIDGVRSREEQIKLFATGASATLNSRHLTGHAVDLAAIAVGKIRYDWPLYYKIHDAMTAAAQELDIPLEWGGDWKKFKDGPHYQLPRKKYP